MTLSFLFTNCSYFLCSLYLGSTQRVEQNNMLFFVLLCVYVLFHCFLFSFYIFCVDQVFAGTHIFLLRLKTAKMEKSHSKTARTNGFPS